MRAAIWRDTSCAHADCLARTMRHFATSKLRARERDDRPSIALTADADFRARDLFLRWRRPHPNMQLAQLRLARLRGRIGHRIRRGLRLREGDHLADAVRSRHQHRQAIQAERDASMRRRAELECIQEEAELLPGFFRTDA